MEKTWRWFGKKDRITLSMLRQIGVEGIVTALHEVPNGEVWTTEAINDLKNYIESYGMRWSVVESLPVCEAIKYGGPERDALIENYKISLANLGKCGVKTVCYNFMPVIDWIRTDLHYALPDGSSSLYFNRIRFAYFDLKILQREGAERDYSPEELQKVEELDRRARQFAEESARRMGRDASFQPGAGAAGGLGYAFLQYLQAITQSGADLLLDLCEFDTLLTHTDLVITGEGHADRQTLMGKLPERVMRRAQAQHVPVWLVAGKASDAESLLNAGFSRVDSLTPDGMPLEEAIRPEVARKNIHRWVETVWNQLKK